MDLSIIVPLYNEVNTIEELIGSVYKNSTSSLDFEVIVVDDGSIDDTPNVLNRIAKKYNNMLTLRLEKNCGKTQAIRKGMELVRGNYIAIQDADLEYNPSDLFSLYKLASDNNYTAVYGSRLKKENPNNYPLFLLGNVLITKYYNFLFKDNITDLSTCYKIFKKDIVNSELITERRFGFCPELTCILRSKGVRIVESPISYYPRSIAEGKKIRAKDGIHFLWIITKNYLKYLYQMLKGQRKNTS